MSIDGGRLEFISSYTRNTKSFEGFDSLVLVCGSVADSDLYYSLKDNQAFEKVYVIGSAWVPRQIAEATQHGATVALEI